jgi:hypothetical protein
LYLPGITDRWRYAPNLWLQLQGVAEVGDRWRYSPNLWLQLQGVAEVGDRWRYAVKQLAT